MSKSQSGFTLLELSIVLVIIGLIVGGITVGGSMIHSAELRAIITEHEHYKTSVLTFKNKYFQLPGDLSNAQSFWGIANATPATCVTTASTGTATCNGDGDGDIDVSTGSNERYRFWQHLANAGMIGGNFNGIAGAGGSSDTELVSAINSPSSKLSGTGWTAINLGTQSADGNFFDGQYNNSLSFGIDSPSGYTNSSALSPEDAWNIDVKMDDGMPGLGNLLARNHATCTEAGSSAATSANYDLDDTNIECALIFRQQF